MITSKLSHIYAKALFKLSSSRNQSDETLKNLESISSIFDKKSFMIFFSSPQISLQEKRMILEKTLGPYLDSALLSFLNLLLDKNLFNQLPNIIKEFHALFYHKFKFMEVFLLTSTDIDNSQKDEIATKLQNTYGKKIIMKYGINPDLLGGGILIFDNKMIDFSIRNKLNLLKESLLSDETKTIP